MTLNDRIEEHATQIQCDRHISQMRACKYQPHLKLSPIWPIDNFPCECRIVVEERLRNPL